MPARILVVEDDPDNRRIAEVALCGAGYEVRAVGNGAEALECCRSERFDLVVLDLGLPGVGGLEVVRELKSSPEPPPVVALTGMALPGDEDRARRMGCDEVLVKPCRVAELRERVGRWVRP